MTRLTFICAAAILAHAVALTSAQSVYPAGTTNNPVTLELVWPYTNNRLTTAGANASNAVYRAYRVPYGWRPQIAMPRQERVTRPAPGDFQVSSSGQNKTITAADCTAGRLGASVASSAIGEPVRSVTLSAPSWVDAANGGGSALPRQRVDGLDPTLEFTYRRYPFAAPLANGTRSFGMWVPNTDPSGSGLILNARFRGQEGANESSPVHTHLGVLGVTSFLIKDLSANPLDCVEGGAFTQRRQELSAILDATNPDFRRFRNAAAG